jgi:hypothetical protein
MAANKSQGSYYGLFLVGCTVLCAGIYLGGGMGKLLLLVGALMFLGSLAAMMKIKPEEGRTPLKPSPTAMKLVGAVVALLGWGITLFGMHLTPSTGGRIIAALVGIAVSLFGILVVLPGAFNKNAIWKS